MDRAPTGRRPRRLVPAFLIALLAATTFVMAARWVGDAPPLAIWAGSVWVLLLSTIVTLPMVVGRRDGHAE